MKGDGVNQVRAAMDLLLDDARSRTFMINMTADDLVDVIPFSGGPVGRFTVAGGKPDEARNLAGTIREMQPDGGTDIYSPVIEALALLATDERGKRVPAVVLMTDGESNTGRTFEDLRTDWQRVGLDIPVFCIMFGKASENQLRGIADLTHGQVFDGRKDLMAAFRKVKGYN
jgi:Ca-activated chloride channel family protein